MFHNGSIYSQEANKLTGKGLDTRLHPQPFGAVNQKDRPLSAGHAVHQLPGKKPEASDARDVFIVEPRVSLQKQPHLRREAVWRGRAVGNRPTCSRRKKWGGGARWARELFTPNRRRLLVYDGGRVAATLR